MTTARIILKALMHGVSPWAPLSRVLLLRSRTLTSGVQAYSAATSPPSKAIVYDQHGSPDVVTRVTELPPVEIKDNDVCVRMLAKTPNQSLLILIELKLLSDLFIKARITEYNMLTSLARQAVIIVGVYPVRPPMPALGDMKGLEVHAIGSAVKGVFPPEVGTWQTYVVKEQTVWQKIIKKHLQWRYAATVTVNPLTALRMLEDFVALKSVSLCLKLNLDCLRIASLYRSIQQSNGTNICKFVRADNLYELRGFPFDWLSAVYGSPVSHIKTSVTRIFSKSS
ncbi:hypothetical protein HAX54_000796 [Datura stramonium]|uniref:Uncharacterized protein n=1 Tax=Datura stramonium TaxID=4076 RepID=A0ABS8WQA0_DATST|nr:hypothetical protein [Datura stramonium]